jgi:hypothetical protein
VEAEKLIIGAREVAAVSAKRAAKMEAMTDREKRAAAAEAR